MKRNICLWIASFFAICLFAVSANAQDAKITRVNSKYNPFDKLYYETVTVELTQSAIRDLRSSGLTKYVVKVKPDNSIWSFFIDLRDAEMIVLTVDKPYGSVCFKSTRKWGKNHYTVETPWGPSR